MTINSNSAIECGTKVACFPFSSDGAAQITSGILAVASGIGIEYALEKVLSHKNWWLDSIVGSSIVMTSAMAISFLIWGVRIWQSINDRKFAKVPVCERASIISAAELGGYFFGFAMGLLFDGLINLLGRDKIQEFIGEVGAPIVVSAARTIVRYGIFKILAGGREALKQEEKERPLSELDLLL